MTVDLIVANVMQNAATAQKIIADTVGQMPATRSCACGRALQSAIMTRPEHIPDAIKKDLAPIIAKYVS
ncbi:MAG: hypothetical protein AABY89_07285 [Acidobacteriota bacterium]